MPRRSGEGSVGAAERWGSEAIAPQIGGIDAEVMTPTVSEIEVRKPPILDQPADGSPVDLGFLGSFLLGKERHELFLLGA